MSGNDSMDETMEAESARLMNNSSAKRLSPPDNLPQSKRHASNPDDDKENQPRRQPRLRQTSILDYRQFSLPWNSANDDHTTISTASKGKQRAPIPVYSDNDRDTTPDPTLAAHTTTRALEIDNEEATSHFDNQATSASGAVSVTLQKTSATQKGLAPFKIPKRHDTSRNKCYFCGLYCGNLDGLKKHQRTGVHNDMKLRCYFCATEFDTIEALDAHDPTKRQCCATAFRNRCTFCYLFHASQELLIEHLETAHLDGVRACCECSETFRSMTDLQRHFHKIHLDPAAYPYRCLQCPARFTIPTLLTWHIEHVHPRCCKWCNSRFESTEATREHQERCELRPVSRKCMTCGAWIYEDESDHVCKGVPRFQVQHSIPDVLKYIAHDDPRAFDDFMCLTIWSSNQDYLDETRTKCETLNFDFAIGDPFEKCMGGCNDNGVAIPCPRQIEISPLTAHYLCQSTEVVDGKMRRLVKLSARCLICYYQDRRHTRKENRTKKLESTDLASMRVGNCQAKGNCTGAIVFGQSYCAMHLAQVVLANKGRDWHAKVEARRHRHGSSNPLLTSTEDFYRSLLQLRHHVFDLEVHKYAKLCLAKSPDIFFLDIEGSYSRLYQLSLVDIDGKVLLDAVIDYGQSRADLIEQLPSSSDTEVNIRVIKKFYDDDGVKPHYRPTAIKLQDLPSRLDALNMSPKSVIFEWAPHDYDVRILRKTLELTTAREIVPAAPVDAFNHWRRHIKNSPTYQLELLFHICFPHCELNKEVAHFARVDTLRLRKIVLLLYGHLNGYQSLLELL